MCVCVCVKERYCYVKQFGIILKNVDFLAGWDLLESLLSNPLHKYSLVYMYSRNYGHKLTQDILTATENYQPMNLM